jgi:hypothetical protein
MRRSWVSLFILVSALACKQTDKSYVVLTFKGTADRPIHRIEVNLTLGLRSDKTSFLAPSGGEIQLPITAALEIASGEGDLTVAAQALDSDAVAVAEGSGSGPVSAGQSSSVLVLLTVPVRDAGVDAFAADDVPSAPRDAFPKEKSFDPSDLRVPTIDVGLMGAGGLVDSGATAGGAGGTTTPATIIGTGGATSGAGGTTTPVTSIGTGGASGAGGTSGPSTLIGYKLTISPPALDFGPVPAGSASAPQALTITNVGDQAAPSLTLFVGDGQRFPIFQDRCSGALLGPGFNCTVAFVFKPNSTGPLQTDGSVTPAQGQPVRFSLTGRGDSTSPQIAMSPNTVDFTLLDVGLSSPIDFKVTSTGGSDPGTLDILLNGSSDFSVVNNGCASVSLPKDGRCAFTLVFNPTTFGPAQVRIDAKSSSGASATSFATGVGRDFVQLSVRLVGTGKGTVTGGNLNCRPANPCAIAIARVDPSALPKVELTAQPDDGSLFAGWGGPCSGTAICGFAMDAPKNVVATFNVR